MQSLRAEPAIYLSPSRLVPECLGMGGRTFSSAGVLPPPDSWWVRPDGEYANQSVAFDLRQVCLFAGMPGQLMHAGEKRRRFKGRETDVFFSLSYLISLLVRARARMSRDGLMVGESKKTAPKRGPLVSTTWPAARPLKPVMEVRKLQNPEKKNARLVFSCTSQSLPNTCWPKCRLHDPQGRDPMTSRSLQRSSS